jgi:hypothetical protein
MLKDLYEFDGDIDLAFRLTTSDSKCRYFEPHNDIRCSG